MPPIDISGWPTSLQTAAIIGTMLGFFVLAILGYRMRYNVVSGPKDHNRDAKDAREAWEEDREVADLRKEVEQQRLREELRREFYKALKGIEEEADHSYAELDKRLRELELAIARSHPPKR